MPDSANISSVNPDQPPANGIYLGFDYGLKRIGIASGQSTTKSATPLTTIRNIDGRPEWDRLDALIEEWRPAGLVIGHPLKDDGTEQDFQPQINAFAKRLHTRYSVPVYHMDERYSSIEASRIIASNRRHANRRKSTHEDTDKVAAAIILEHWLNDKNN